MEKAVNKEEKPVLILSLAVVKYLNFIEKDHFIFLVYIVSPLVHGMKILGFCEIFRQENWLGHRFFIV